VKGYIEKLVIEGFKSYGRQRIEIPLGEGFIAVVGPNGAGKSNIGDAISFALGIATSKALRAKNLSYLIFSKDGEKQIMPMWRCILKILVPFLCQRRM
jgi:chromosome segregation protein